MAGSVQACSYGWVLLVLDTQPWATFPRDFWSAGFRKGVFLSVNPLSTDRLAK